MIWPRLARRLVLAALAASALLAASPSRAAETVPDARKSLADFDPIVEKALKDFKVPGLALAVVKDGEVVLLKGYGKRNLEKDRPVTPQTLFAIGSCTKAFTTFVMGTLVEAGKLEWDKPVRTYIPGFRLSDPAATELLTPRDLVTHRSGLPRHDMAWYNTTMSRQALVSRLPYFEFSEPIRAKFQYNNLMYLTAGYLVEVVDGRPWEDVVRERLFGPIGMTRSNFSVHDSQKADDFATPYDEQEDKVLAIPFRDIANVGPAGSINSCAEDMAKWAAVHSHRGKLGGKQIIGTALLEEMHSPQMPMGAPPEKKEISSGSYGLGWMIDTYRGHRRVHHGGAIDGFTANTCLFPDDGLAIVVLNNMNGSRLPDLITKHASDRLLGLDTIDWLGEGLDKKTKGRDAEKDAKKNKDEARRPGTRPAHALEEYAGDYGHPGYGTLTVALRGGKLVSKYNRIEATLEHWHFEVFAAPKADNDPALNDLNLKLQFQDDLKGYVTSVAVPLEPRVKPIVFVKTSDRRLSDPAYLKRFAGDYELAGETMTIRLQGDVLVLDQKGRPSQELTPDRNDEFNVKLATGLSLRFLTDKDGKVEEIALSTPSGVFKAKRKP
jgi:CubicO group peptidase (beta-lactamase class C family)